MPIFADPKPSHAIAARNRANARHSTAPAQPPRTRPPWLPIIAPTAPPSARRAGRHADATRQAAHAHGPVRRCVGQMVANGCEWLQMVAGIWP